MGEPDPDKKSAQHETDRIYCFISGDERHLTFCGYYEGNFFTQTSRRPPDGTVLSFLKSSNCINSLRKQSRINHTRGFPANATLYQKHWYQVPSLPEYQQEW